MARTNPFEFLQAGTDRGLQGHVADAQGDRHHRRLVLVMVIAAALFFLAVDQVLST